MSSTSYLHKSHNVTVLLYHLVCPAKYRRVVIDAEVDAVLRDVCLEIAQRYEIVFVEIGTDGDHVHFLLQSIPAYSPTKIVRIVKSLTAREVLARYPQVKKKLWGGEFWSDGYFMASVGQHGNAETIGNYVRQQGSTMLYQHAVPATSCPAVRPLRRSYPLTHRLDSLHSNTP